jgi:protein-S-isoprenylcysteine O-methyltransferase Ste14
LSTRWVRLRAVWLLVPLFLWFARPTPLLLAVGGVLALVGLALRAWAAGFIKKDQELTTGGPYAFTRNPLYLGSLLLGIGVVLAGGSWVFAAVFLGFFVLVYGRTMKREEAQPLLAPRLPPYHAHEGGERSFSAERYWRHREYEALLGTLAGFALLTIKLLWATGR